MPCIRRVTRNFLGHFDKHSPTIQERKAPQGINLQFFRLKKGRGDLPPSSYAPAVCTALFLRKKQKEGRKFIEKYFLLNE